MKAKTIALLGLSAFSLYRLAQQTGLPPGVRPAIGFELPAHLGRWYEIARIDHAYEAGLTDTTVDYLQSPGGRLHLSKRSYHGGARRWREARASVRAINHGGAHMQLCFVWPIHASHTVFYTDAQAQHALVCGHNHNYLWLLARRPQIKASVRADLLERARAAGFDTERLHWVDQRRNLSALG